MCSNVALYRANLGAYVLHHDTMSRCMWHNPKRASIENEQLAGLKGFEPLTAGLKVRCATWLRHRPPASVKTCTI